MIIPLVLFDRVTLHAFTHHEQSFTNTLLQVSKPVRTQRVKTTETFWTLNSAVDSVVF